MITTYSELKTAIESWSHRTDLTSKVDDFIDLCEADLQVKCKTVDFENSASLSVVGGSASLPADYLGARAVYWSGTTSRFLTYLTPAAFVARKNDSGTPSWYTVIGTTIMVAPNSYGDLVIDYKAKFVPLSDSNTSNAILANYPHAYLQGGLLQAAIYAKDTDGMTTHGALFNEAIDTILEDNKSRKYPGPLEVKAR